MKKVYEDALMGKENARQETVRQLEQMHELLTEQLKSLDVSTMERTIPDETIHDDHQNKRAGKYYI